MTKEFPLLREKGLLGASLAYWALVLALRPFADIPLNDDWAYARSVALTLNEGHLRLSESCSASAVSQILWGAFFSRLFGGGYAALRLSTLVLGWLEGLCFYALLRGEQVDEEKSAGLTLLLLFNPIQFPLWPSFMTDGPFNALSLLSLTLSWQGVRHGGLRLGWLWAGSAAAALAYGILPMGIALPIGLALWILLQGRLTMGALAALATLPVLAAAIHQYWFHFVHGSTLLWNLYLKQTTLLHLSEPGHLAASAGLRFLAALLYAGLFALPVSAACWRERPIEAWRLLSKRQRGAVTALSAILLVFALGWGALPYPNGRTAFGMAGTDFFSRCSYLGPSGIGCFNIEGADLRGLPLFGGVWFWKILSLLAWASASTLLAQCMARPLPLAGFLAVPLALQVAFTFISLVYFDRFLTPLAAPALLGGLACWKISPGRGAFWAGIALWAAMAWAGTYDWLRSSEAAWSLGHEALASGFKPERVLVSADWCWDVGYAKVLDAKLRLGPERARLKDIFPSECLRTPEAMVSFREGLPRSRLAARDFFSPLAMRRQSLFLYDLRARSQ